MNGMILAYEVYLEGEGNDARVCDRLGQAIQVLLKQGEGFIEIVGSNGKSGTATLDTLEYKDVIIPNSIEFIIKE